MLRRPRRSRLALAAVLAAAHPTGAAAHQRGLSRAELRVVPDAAPGSVRIAAELVFARPEIVELVPRADADRNGQLDEIELLSVETALSEHVREGVQLEVDGRPCAGVVERIAFVEEDGLAVVAGFVCPAAPPLAGFTVRLPLLARLNPGHRLLGHVVFQDMPEETDAPALDFVAHRRRAALTVRRPTRERAPERADEPAPAEAAPSPAPRQEPARWPWLVLVAAATAALATWLSRRRRRG
ncbi:MAG TPA: hypothetical protein VIK91_18385 [Nannocystis sp.]